jgi:hypothetical protein
MEATITPAFPRATASGVSAPVLEATSAATPAAQARAADAASPAEPSGSDGEAVLPHTQSSAAGSTTSAIHAATACPSVARSDANATYATARAAAHSDRERHIG